MKDDLYIKNGIAIPAHEISVTTSRAGGPGGQHVNKSDTRITLRWNINKTQVFSEIQKNRVLEKLASQLTEDGELIIHNSSTRSQLQNKELAYKQLAAKIRAALHVTKKRMKTKISAGIKEKRLQHKKKQSELKKLRSRKNDY